MKLEAEGNKRKVERTADIVGKVRVLGRRL